MTSMTCRAVSHLLGEGLLVILDGQPVIEHRPGLDPELGQVQALDGPEFRLRRLAPSKFLETRFSLPAVTWSVASLTPWSSVPFMTRSSLMFAGTLTVGWSGLNEHVRWGADRGWQRYRRPPGWD